MLRRALCLLLIFCLPAVAQLTGRVLDDETRGPVEGAAVTVGDASTFTDETGSYQLPAGADTLRVTRFGYEPIALAARPGLVIYLVPRALRADDVVVTAGLTRQRLSEITASVDVVSADELVGQRHLQDLTDGMANLHWSGGTSRPRYFQIRGIGERSQYAGEGAPSFAVGFVVDDVELSGLGTTAMLFDMDQVEVFKGPQSTVFGPDAMAGLISMRSAAPDPSTPPIVQAGIGSDAMVELGAAANVSLAEHWSARLSGASQQSNGFRHNNYLDVDDTNERSERTLRAKVQYENGDRLAVLTAFHSLADNGYDAWAPDNNEEFVTYSDQPGRDEQETAGFSLRLQLPLSPVARVVSIWSASMSDVEYSYDGDWGNDAFWAQPPYGFDAQVEGWSYQFFDQLLRTRTTATQEARLLVDRVPGVGGEGVIGAYGKQIAEEDDAEGYLFNGDAAILDSEFDVTNLALYSQWQRALGGGVRLLVNLRADRHETEYVGIADADAAAAVRFTTDGWLTGGRIALSRRVGTGLGFVALSRGYRPGAVNQHPRLTDRLRPYDAETVWNIESGWRLLANRHSLSVTLFHARRQDQQVEISTQIDPGDPNSFLLYKANAAGGWNAGAEVEARYRLTRATTLHASGGWLSTHTDAYTFETAEGVLQTLGDREAAHAPSYTLRLGADYDHPSGVFAQGQVTSTDGFYHSDSHDQRADTQQQLHASIGYRRDGWSIRLWGRNLLDERYATRGFYFGLAPPNYDPTLYQTWGDPRQIGVTVRTRVPRP